MYQSKATEKALHIGNTYEEEEDFYNANIIMMDDGMGGDSYRGDGRGGVEEEEVAPQCSVISICCGFVTVISNEWLMCGTSVVNTKI
jgi:hypothetical protein